MQPTPESQSEQQNISPAEAQEALRLPDQLHARNFLVSFPLSQGRAIETQPILFEYLRRQYTPEQLSNLDAIDESVRTRFLPKFRIPTTEHTADFQGTGTELAGEDASAFIAGEFEKGWTDYMRVMKQEYSPEDIEGEYPDLGPGSLHEVSDARLVAKIAEDLMRSDRMYLMHGRPNRQPESDAFESLFREHILNDRPMQTQQFQQMSRDVLALMQRLGLDQPSANHEFDQKTLADLDLGLETASDLRHLRTSLQQEWEEKHPSLRFNDAAAFEQPSKKVTWWENSNYEHGLVASLNQEVNDDVISATNDFQQQPQQPQQGKMRGPDDENEEVTQAVQPEAKNKSHDLRSLFTAAAANDPENLDSLMYRLLSERDEQILRDRFLRADGVRSLNNLAADNDLTPQAIGQIIRKALKKLEASGELAGNQPPAAKAEATETPELETEKAKKSRQNREQYERRKVTKILGEEALRGAIQPEKPKRRYRPKKEVDQELREIAQQADLSPDDPERQQTPHQEPQALALDTRPANIGKVSLASSQSETALPFDLEKDSLPSTFADIQDMKLANPGSKSTDGSKKSKGKTK